jgi:DNA-binding Lrp family transcriptional regulator
MKALILIKFTSLETRDAYHHLKRLKPVIESFMVYGRFDAVAIVQGSDLGEIRRIILSEIHPIPGVIETLPCIIVEDESMTLAEQELRPKFLRPTA